MENTDDILKELKNISPRLAEIPRKDAFNVPEGYFNDLHGKVIDRIQLDQKPDNVVKGHIFGHSALKWVAASIIILILGSGYYYLAWNSFYDSNSATEAYVLENVDEEIIADYVTEIPVKDNKKKEILDNSLENIDEDIIIEEL